jgi:signal transduction histidine kinase
MATVLGIVTRHRGAIEVDSAEGHGSRFCVYLPREQAVAAEVEAVH